uniref:Telo_bind domain-containing protein n=1 Tax=Bursaphelenchus xylophilus TaxID=6326 RepID=A0A1I7S7C5_BURXY
MRRRRGLTLLDENKRKVPVNSLDDLPPLSGFSFTEVGEALRDHSLVEHHVLWATYLRNQSAYSKSSINLDILLPNGYIYSILTPLHWTLKHLKEQLLKYVKIWTQDCNIDASCFIFSSVGDNGECLELYDEERSLDTVHMFLPFLVMTKPSDIDEEMSITEKIEIILGEPLVDLVSRLNPELKNFRLELFESTKRADDERGTSGTFHYAFPEETILPNIADRVFSPNLHSEVHEEDVEFWWYPTLPSDADHKAMQALRKKVERSKIGIEIWYRETEESEQGVSVGIKDIFDKKPCDIIGAALEILGRRENPADFILQVVGRKSFITLHKPILKFEYIRSCFENYREPKLLLRRKKTIFSQFPPPPKIFTPSYIRSDRFARKYPCTTKVAPVCFWEMDQVLSINMRGISNVQEYDSAKIYVKAVLAVGRHILDVKSTPAVPSNAFRHFVFDFNVYMKDVPESAQMCFLLYSANKKEVDEEPLAYVNVRLFDWRNVFCQGKSTFYLRRPPKGSSVASVLLLPCGGSTSHNSVRIEVEFPEIPGKELEFPDWEEIEKFNKFIRLRRDINGESERLELDPILVR